MHEKTTYDTSCEPSQQKTSPLWQELLQHIEAAWPAVRYRDVGVCVGCSGGADSVALVLAMASLRTHDQHLTSPESAQLFSRPPRGFMELIHVNHRLRGADSDQDEAFVRELADRVQAKFSVVCLTGSTTDEATLREAREQAFSEAAHASGARYVAVAHSQDDVAETMLMQLIRGTGPAGLASMPTFRSLGYDAVLVRPMLQCSRQLIRDALRSIGEPWREDSSNLNTGYTRNWLRHEILPLMEARFPGATTRIAKSATAQGQWRQTIEQLARDWMATHVQRTAGEATLQVNPQTPPSILVESLRQLWLQQSWPQKYMTASHWSKLAQSLREPSESRYDLPGDIHVESNRDAVRLTRVG